MDERDATLAKWVQCLQVLIEWFSRNSAGVHRMPNPSMIRGLTEAKQFLEDMRVAGVDPPPWPE